MANKPHPAPHIVGTMRAVEGAETMPKRRRPRKPTLSQALREAAKGGANVAGAVIEPDGKIALTFGKPGVVKANGQDDDLDRELKEFEEHHGES